MKKKEFETIVEVGHNDTIYDRSDIPEDYHCTCHFCTDNFVGEIYYTPEDKYYTQATRNRYYIDKDSDFQDKHICPGHWSGYRYAIQKFTRPGDWILDPTVGTGTAVVESINNGRHAIGIELEFSEITKRTVALQYTKGRALGKGKIVQGDARNCESILQERGFKKNSFDMIINGTPYPVLGGRQSDSPARSSPKSKGVKEIFYENDQNVGVLSGERYWDTINHIYNSAIEYLRPGGKFITIIKDPTQKKAPYLLHKLVTEQVLANNPVKYYGSFVHRHLPYTLFMRSYKKMYPEVALPLYQTGIILEKI